MANTTMKRNSCAVLTLEYSTINAMIEEVAEEELGETKTKRDECLDELRSKIKNEENLHSCTTDNFLLQFLRVKKFDTEKAFKRLKRFYQHKLQYQFLYENYTPGHYQKTMKAHFMTFLPLRTPEGCAIWAVRLGLWDSSATKLPEVIKFGLMCHEHALKNPVTQICGIVSVLDLKGFSWSQLFQTSASAIKGFINAVQDCFPIRHKAIHIINCPSIFDILFSIIKPLLNYKIRDRIHFHGDISSLHEAVPPNMLPEEFGGTCGTFQNHQFYNSLLDSELEFEEQNKLGYNVKDR